MQRGVTVRQIACVAAGSKSGAPCEVTPEVEGQGRTPVTDSADGSVFEPQTLPWKERETVELTAAERKAGCLGKHPKGYCPCLIKWPGAGPAAGAECGGRAGPAGWRRPSGRGSAR